MFENREITEVIRIAAAGGGFRMDGSNRSTEELIRVAAASRSKGARLEFSGLHHRSTNELIRIAAAGGGNVVFV
jgi:DNA replication protein